MSRGKRGHRLSRSERLRGIEKALRSKRTPPWLKESMRRYAARLRGSSREDGT